MVRTPRLIAFAIALVMALATLPALTSTRAYACSCVGWSFQEAIDQADLVADVQFRSAISNKQGLVTYDVVVNTVWKGEQRRNITIRTEQDITACGLGKVSPGTDLLVWAYGSDGSYSTTWCALPTDGGPDDRERLTQTLGQPADLTDQPTAPPALHWPTVAMIAVPVLVIGMAGGLLVWRARRRRPEAPFDRYNSH